MDPSPGVKTWPGFCQSGVGYHWSQGMMGNEPSPASDSWQKSSTPHLALKDKCPP